MEWMGHWLLSGEQTKRDHLLFGRLKGGSAPEGEKPTGRPAPTGLQGELTSSFSNRFGKVLCTERAMLFSFAPKKCDAAPVRAGVQGTKGASGGFVGEGASLDMSSETGHAKLGWAGVEPSGDRRDALTGGFTEGPMAFSGVSSRSDAAQRGGWMRRPVRVAPKGRAAPTGLAGSAADSTAAPTEAGSSATVAGG